MSIAVFQYPMYLPVSGSESRKSSSITANNKRISNMSDPGLNRHILWSVDGIEYPFRLCQLILLPVMTADSLLRIPSTSVMSDLFRPT